MSGSGLDQSIMIQRMNLQAPQLQYGQGGAEDDGVDEALLKSDPEQKEKREKVQRTSNSKKACI